MGLRRRLAEHAVSRAHALVVEVPGWWQTRFAVEQALDARGWRTASSPADADVLLVCGNPGDALGAAADRVWDQLPGPRARVSALAPAAVTPALDEAAARLLDLDHQRTDARERKAEAPDEAEDEAEATDRDDDADEDHGDMDHGDMDHGDMDMAPAGIPLADGGPDRDGLEMDVLRVPLGPVLPQWPAGLVLHCSLQGDVVVAAGVEVLGARVAAPDGVVSTRARAARLCDGAGRLLAVAGWGAAAGAARSTRDALLAEAGLDHGNGVRRVDRLLSTVTRSRTLRWSLRGLGHIDDAMLLEHHLPPETLGDAYDRLLAMLERARVDLRDGPTPGATDLSACVAVLPRLVTGLDLAAARLVVASMVPDTAVLHDEEPVGA